MPVGWIIVVVTLWLAVVVLAVLVIGLMRQVTSALEQAAATARPETPESLVLGPRVGSALTPFTATDTSGETIDEQWLRGEPALLLFLHSGCVPCQQIAGDMGQADLDAMPGRLIIVTDPDGPRALGLPSSLHTLVESARQVSDALMIKATPYAVAVDPDGVVRGAGVAGSMERLAAIAEQARPAELSRQS
jgi:hypothetical protein